MSRKTEASLWLEAQQDYRNKSIRFAKLETATIQQMEDFHISKVFPSPPSFQSLASRSKPPSHFSFQNIYLLECLQQFQDVQNDFFKKGLEFKGSLDKSDEARSFLTVNPTFSLPSFDQHG